MQLTIQILQYEFLGPIKLSEWGPPMDRVAYIIFSKNKDVESDECRKYRTWVIADQELEEILKNAQNEE